MGEVKYTLWGDILLIVALLSKNKYRTKTNLKDKNCIPNDTLCIMYSTMNYMYELYNVILSLIIVVWQPFAM